MERKDLEDLIQRLWDQGASIEIMKILEHDKQQREALTLVQVERDVGEHQLVEVIDRLNDDINYLRHELVEARFDLSLMASEVTAAVRDVDEAVTLLQEIDEYLSRHQDDAIFSGSKLHQRIKELLSASKQR